MEVDLGRRRAVREALGLGESIEDRERPVAHRLREVRRLEHPADVPQAQHSVPSLLDEDVHLGAG